MTEHRVHPRAKFSLPVRLVRADGSSEETSCRDVSLGGVFVETAQTEPFNAKVTVHMTLPTAPRPVVVPCTVRWSKPDGLGLQFGVMGARDTHALTELLAQG